MTDRDPLVVFTPSGKRGRFPVGTPLLSVARTLGVDVDSVCGGRGICGRCQVLIAEGEFAKHGVRSGAASVSPVSETEQRYAKRRGLPAGHRLSCSTTVQGDVVVDVPPGSQVHRQVVRKDADARVIKLNPVVRLHYVEVREPDMHDPSGDLRRLLRGARARVAAHRPRLRFHDPRRAAGGAAQGRVESDGRGARRLAGDRAVAGLPRQGLRHGGGRRLDDGGGTPVRPRDRRAGRRRGHDEPADPLRRGPDEPGLVRDDEPGRRGDDDRRDPRRARRARGRSRARGRRRDRRHPRDDAGRQPDHASPGARHRSGRARRRAVRARGRPGADASRLGARHRRASRTRASTCCPASPATSAPTPPA